MLSRSGSTRSTIRANHALLTPESFERITQPGWDGAEFVYVITPQMGARFSMALVETSAAAEATIDSSGHASFLFVLGGQLEVKVGSGSHRLTAEDFVFLPPSLAAGLRYENATRFVLYQWRFIASGERYPDLYVGHASERPSSALRGDETLQVQKLLPTDPIFDGEFNIMTFEPGASLAYVETHFMEHGLLFLDGGGVYRLDENWYPVEKGDFIWMGPHVPQWFGALGRTRSRYLIYKNYNRSPIAG
ncbi:(S)-ureidoglycine aminohydrolase [Rhizobium puerariae]|uniref:(S)-ureidoglycine aminohydrolase n=1 Tax=Rhizobium puerariae TaxID=1585791 RepID=A0ABV6AEL2_9HYPH